MTIKVCTKCKGEKALEEFSKWSRSEDGLFYQCKECRKKENEIYRKNNRKKILCNSKKYYKKHYKKHKLEINQRHKIDYQLNKNKWKSTRKKYYEKNKTWLLELQKKRLEDPKVKEKRRRTSNKRDRERMKADINYKLKKRLRCRVWNALKGNYKTKHTDDLLGCNTEKLREYIQSKFHQGMSWINYGKWHIDHIIPCAKFDLSKPVEQKQCFHYTNLQPLWAKDNQKKSDKIL